MQLYKQLKGIMPKCLVSAVEKHYVLQALPGAWRGKS
jgi:hypothetical protein